VVLSLSRKGEKHASLVREEEKEEELAERRSGPVRAIGGLSCLGRRGRKEERGRESPGRG
jgi:hypothetical protein